MTVYIHSLFEWVLISDLSEYLLAIEIGLVAGLAERLGYWRRSTPHHVPLRVGALAYAPTKSIGNPRDAT